MNWKADVAKTKSATLSLEQAIAKFTKLANGFVAAGKISVNGNRYKISVGAGSKFYPVYLIAGKFLCDCNDNRNYLTCAHTLAAEMFAAKAERAESGPVESMIEDFSWISA